MSGNHGAFATAITCIDGRAIEPTMDFMRQNYGVAFVDTISKAGLDGRLSNMSETELADLKKEVMVSVEKHSSKAISVQGHDQCAGNPVSSEQHTEDLKKDVELVKSWNLGIPTVGLWVAPVDGKWTATKVA